MIEDVTYRDSCRLSELMRGTIKAAGRGLSRAVASCGLAAALAVAFSSGQAVADPRECHAKRPPPVPREWEVRGELVLDWGTCLMWTQGDLRTMTGEFAESWSEAMAWAAEMNAKHLGGHDDWRVPSIAEYRTLLSTIPYRKTFSSQGEFAFWARNEINRWVASYYRFDGAWSYGTSTSKDPRQDLREDRRFSARLVRRFRVAQQAAMERDEPRASD